jgi:alpha-mannosidase
MSLRDMLREASVHVQHQVGRIDAELRFAETLCQWIPAEAETWRPLIADARALLAAELAARRTDDIASAVKRAEELLAPIGKRAKDYTVHCVGHAHIDMNWMWSWPETVAVTVDTFGTVLRLMDEFPEFRFSQSQASTYAIVEQHRPDMLERIAQRVAERRWEVTASHWVEGDKNLASGESLCRHMLYTRQYMEQLFDLAPDDVRVDWSPDTFGHAITVPTYLVRGGVRYLYMHRPGAQGPERPWLFWWQAPDGSRVLVRNDSRSSHAYNGQVSAETIARDLGLFVENTGLRDHMFIYGVGDHGGGPTRQDISQIIDIASWPIFPQLRFGTVGEYMDLVADQAARLPVLDCELNFEFAGCYTTQSVIKRDNRLGENKLVDSEAAATLAWLGADLDYPTATLTQGWRDILFSHFHDILPGSGVHDTRAYTHGLFQQAMASTAQVEVQALRALAACVDTSAGAEDTQADAPATALSSSLGAGVGFRSVDGSLPAADQSSGQGARPFVLFNPSQDDRTEVVQATVWATRTDGPPLESRTYAVSTADGKRAPAQVVGNGDYWGHQYVDLAFPARVSGLGYAAYTVLETEDTGPSLAGGAQQMGKEHPCRYSMHERSSEALENESLLLELDPITGGIQRLTDKRSGVELMSPESSAPPLELVDERPHGMTAWLVDHQQGPAEHPRVRALRRTLRGPYRAAIEVDLAIRESTFTLTYELRAGEPRVHVHLRGTWFQRGTKEAGVPTLNFVLPLALAEARARYEIPFGAIDRELNSREEVPALQWAQVAGTSAERRAGCVIANDCKYGHSLEGSVLRLTLIRGSYEPDPLPEIGEHEVRLALLPFAEDLPVECAIQEGNNLNHPIRVLSTDVHQGTMPPTAQCIAVSPQQAVLSGVKKAEDGDALIVRMFNPGDQEVAAQVKVDTALMGTIREAVEVDLMEAPLADSRARSTGDRATVPVPARGIASLRLAMDRG